MSIFNININHLPISYSNKTSYNIYERCSLSIITTETIQLLNTDNAIYSILNSYSGSNKSKLIITSINSSHPNLNVKYNSNIITNTELPLEIDISSLSDTDNIPNLIIDIDIPIKKIIGDLYLNNINDDGDDTLNIGIDDLVTNVDKDFLILPKGVINDNVINKDSITLDPTNSINISFYIKDVNNEIGNTVTSSFQVQTEKCGSISAISSSLPIVSDNDGIINYQILTTNRPLFYQITGLPLGITYNGITGLITGTSIVVGTHNINIQITNEYGIASIDTTLQIINNNVLLPVITSVLNVTTTGTLIYRIEATNNPTSFEFILPVELQSNTIIFGNTITSKLNTVSSGTYNISIAATNSVGTDSETLILTIP
tara:strand:+ start:349 stop:1467 length:1119 start_codon:yes stop_codon:yes gene_type:complete